MGKVFADPYCVKDYTQKLNSENATVRYVIHVNSLQKRKIELTTFFEKIFNFTNNRRSKIKNKKEALVFTNKLGEKCLRILSADEGTVEEALSAKGNVNWCKILESNMIVKEKREMKVSRKGKWPIYLYNIY